jgi:hypothetical protein
MWDQVASLGLWDTVMQVLIPVMSILAVASAQLEVLQKWNARKYAPIIGLAVQPCWAYTAVVHGQVGVLITGVFFTAMWARGLYEQWFLSRSKASDLAG